MAARAGARIGGVFVCFARGGSGPGNAGDHAWAAAFVGEEQLVVPGRAGAPYQPSLLALREGAVLEAAVRALLAPPTSCWSTPPAETTRAAPASRSTSAQCWISRRSVSRTARS